MALYCFDRGYEKFYPRFKESVRIDRVFKSIGKILGTRASYIVTSMGGAALDIDHPEDREVIEENDKPLDQTSGKSLNTKTDHPHYKNF